MPFKARGPVAMHHRVLSTITRSNLVSIHLLSSLVFVRHPHSHHPSLICSFTPGSKHTFSTNPPHLYFPYFLTAFADHGTEADVSCSSVYLLVRFSFKFSV